MHNKLIQSISGKFLKGLLMLSLVLFSTFQGFIPRASAEVEAREAHAQIRLIVGAFRLGRWVVNNWEGLETTTSLVMDKEYREQHIWKTILAAGIASATALPMHLTFGWHPDRVSNCAILFRDIELDGNVTNGIPNTNTALAGFTDDAGNLPQDFAAAAYEDLIEVDLEDGETPCNVTGTPFNMGDSGFTNTGSLLSMATHLDNTVRRDELPVNLAVFTRHYAQKIPLVKNTAFAQTQDNFLGAQMIYYVWRAVRNISLGLMSLILLVVGVMIMTRKKINPQTVVTLQNALPRVALSLGLIFFSYPIGALLVKLIFPLTVIIPSIMTNIVTSSGVVSSITWLSQFLNGGLSLFSSSMIGYGMLSLIGLMIWNSPGVGFAVSFFIATLALGLLLAGFIALIRILITYIRLLTYIVVSPIYFVLGAIPGKESMIVDWFKEMAVGILSIVSMLFMIAFAFLVPVFAIGSGQAQSFLTNSLTNMFAPVIMIFSLVTAVGMPGKVKKWIMGDKRR